MLVYYTEVPDTYTESITYGEGVVYQGSPSTFTIIPGMFERFFFVWAKRYNFVHDWKKKSAYTYMVGG